MPKVYFYYSKSNLAICKEVEKQIKNISYISLDYMVNKKHPFISFVPCIMVDTDDDIFYYKWEARTDTFVDLENLHHQIDNPPVIVKDKTWQDKYKEAISDKDKMDIIAQMLGLTNKK